MIELERIASLAVSAASGLVRVGDVLFVVADDELALHRYALDGRPLGDLRLFDGELPDDPVERKHAKPDHESLVALPDGRFLALGSCSKVSRQRAALVDGPGVTHVDLAPLARALAPSFDRLNIEGAAVLSPHFVLLTRRTGRQGRNTMVRLDLDRVLASLDAGSLDAGALVDIVAVELGDEQGVPYGFTDGTAEGDVLVFSAAAEATDDPVEDGACAGCVIGRIDASGRVIGRWPTSPRAKIEGIALAADGSLFAVADADDRGVLAPLFRARLP